MEIDFGKTAQDYKTHRQGFPPAFFERLQERDLIGVNKRVLDLGTGTGTVARGIALTGSDVTALDIAPQLIEQAKILDATINVQIDYHIASAEATGMANESFDLVTAGQCWHWFDRSRTASEVERVLVQGGYVVIAHLDWIPLPNNVVELTEKLILKHNPDWMMSGGTGIYPQWLGDLAIAGFEDIETFSFDLGLAYTHEAWRGRIRASAGISASLAPEAVNAFDNELKTELNQHFNDDPLNVHHRVWAVIARKG